MIFGLIFSTALTLVVVPTLYVTFVEKLKMKVVKAVQ
jgi:multidrug efflux pump subunit AcrB